MRNADLGPAIADRLAGGIWGLLVGDAAGVPYEFREPERIGEFRFGIQGVIKIDPSFSHQVPAGTWSDDGSLVLALLDSLLQSPGGRGYTFDLADQGRRFRAWYEGGAYTPDGVCFDIGNTTRAALEALRAGTSPERSGPAGEHNQSNGALMRILPLALVPGSIDALTLARQAARSSAVTHGHPLCQVTSALHVLAARRLLTDPQRGSATSGAQRALAGVRAELRAILAAQGLGGLSSDALDALEAWPAREGRGQVADAFWSAWDAFAGARSFAESVERAIRYGHDTDTTAAIAGGLAGLWWGQSGIPADWRAQMLARSLVDPLVARLWRAWGLR